MTKRAYVGMICGQSVDFSVQGVMMGKKQVRGVRLLEFVDNQWKARVRTGKHRGQEIFLKPEDIIILTDRDGKLPTKAAKKEGNNDYSWESVDEQGA